MPRSLAHIQDELLVIRCQDGESEALEALIERWRVRLRAHAWSLTRDPEAIAEVSQEAWLAIARGLQRLTDPSQFGAWAHRIVTHKCADWTRARQRDRVRLRQAADAQRARPVAEIGGDPAASRLRAGLERLAPDSRAILTMQILGEMSVNQIASALDLPVGTVKSRLHHAREDLRVAFERQPP